MYNGWNSHYHVLINQALAISAWPGVLPLPEHAQTQLDCVPHAVRAQFDVARRLVHSSSSLHADYILDVAEEFHSTWLGDWYTRRTC